MRRLAVVPLILLSAGCLVGPNYQRPQVVAPDAFRYEVAEAQQTADVAWWRQFGDPTLDSLIAEAIANNKSLRIAAANVEQASALLRQARSQFYPQVGAQASGAKQRASDDTYGALAPYVTNPKDTWELVGTVSWELDLWGRIRRLSEAARAQLLASEEARRGVVLSLVASVANSYLQLRGLDQQLLIASSTRDAYSESVRLFELQFKYGVATQMTVEQARISYETVAATIPQIENQIAQTENLINTLLGRNPGPVARGKSILEITLPAVPSGVPSQLLERRPDIRQAEDNLIALNAQLGATKALYYPTISLTGVFGQSSASLDNLFKGPAREWAYGGSIVGPIFTGGAISGQVRQVEAAREAALVAYEAAIQNAFADVEDSLIARTKLLEQITEQEKLVTASKEYARLARLQFDGGYSPYFTVLQAEQQLFPAELNLVQYRFSLGASIVNIYKAMAGGWVAQADALPAASEHGGAPAAEPSGPR
jgi:outer membrane protein, multidrug efflux system